MHNSEYIGSKEIYNLQTQAIGYNLFCCSGCRWTSSATNKGYLGGNYVYNKSSRALLAVGSTKTGSMLKFYNFYKPLGNKECAGEALKKWWVSSFGNYHNSGTVSWHYGMTIVGDPLINFNYDPHYSYVDTVNVVVEDDTTAVLDWTLSDSDTKSRLYVNNEYIDDVVDNTTYSSGEADVYRLSIHPVNNSGFESGNNKFVDVILGDVTVTNKSPVNLDHTVSGYNVTLTWSASDIRNAKYGVFRNRVKVAELINGELLFNDNNLEKGTYTYCVTKITDEDEYPSEMITVVVNSNGIGELLSGSFDLECYPNPFNPVTKINYEIGEVLLVTPVHLSVYNSGGQLVETLVNGMQGAGKYSVKFDGSDLNSGVYYYRLSVSGKIHTGKMILLK